MHLYIKISGGAATAAARPEKRPGQKQQAEAQARQEARAQKAGADQYEETPPRRSRIAQG